MWSQRVNSRLIKTEKGNRCECTHVGFCGVGRSKNFCSGEVEVVELKFTIISVTESNIDILCSLLFVYFIFTLTIYLLHASPLRWSGPPGPGFRLHLRDGVSHQSRERVPQPAARGPQRAAHAEKHAAGDKVSLMDRLIRFCSLTVFIGCSLS